MKITLKIPKSIADGMTGKVRAKVLTAAKRAFPKIGAFVIDHMSVQADQVLNLTAADYKRGLQQPESLMFEDTKVTIALIGDHAQALERGFDAFNMKTALLKNAKPKTRKDGSPGALYVDVPFRHGASSSSINFPGMPKDIKAKIDRAIAKNRNSLVASGATKEQAALAKTRLRMKTPGKSFNKDLKFGDKMLKLRGKHKQGIYDDMVATPGKTGKRTTNTYSTMRRVSENSDPSAWIHPGFRGVKLFEKVRSIIKPAAIKILLDELKKEGLL